MMTINNDGTFNTWILSGAFKISNTGLLNVGVSLYEIAIDNVGTIALGANTTAATATINNRSGKIEFSGNATAGSARITNDGTLTFKDRSSLASAYIINNGVLALHDYVSMGAGRIENEGSVTLGEYASLGEGDIDNVGKITFSNFSGAGNASLVNAGTAEIRFIDNGSAANAKLDNAGRITFLNFASGANATITNWTAGSVVDISGLTAGGTPLGALAGEGTVALGSKSLTVGGNNANTVFSGVIKDGGVAGGTGGMLIKEGTGKLTLSGTQTYTGATTINAGNLNVNGSIARSSVVNLNKGGTLSGSGNFGNVVNNGGTLSPGNSIGTMHINGNLTMNPGSLYYVEINGVASDRIEVTGTANISSSVFEIGHDTNTASPPVLPGTTYTLITTGGGLTVTAPQVAIADFPFLAFTLSADAYNGYLTTSRSSERFASLASTSNERAVANALDTASAASPLWQQIVGASEAQARAAFTSLSTASFHASAVGVLSEQSIYLRDAVIDRMRQDFGPATPLAPASTALTYVPETPNVRAATAAGPFHKAPPAAVLPPPEVYAVWAQGVGSWGKLNGDGNAAAIDHSVGGIVSGVDVTFNGLWRVGLAAGFSESNFNTPNQPVSGSSDNYSVTLYGGGQFGAWGLRGGASFGWGNIETSRQVTAGALAGAQRGAYDATTTQVFGDVGYTFAFGSASIEPFANFAYVHVDSTVKETGFAAVSGDAEIDTTFATLGLRGAFAMTSLFTARGSLGWQHALGDVVPMATLAFQSGGTPFALAGTPIARDALVAELGADLAIAPNAAIGVAWNGQFGNGDTANAVKGYLNWRF